MSRSATLTINQNTVLTVTVEEIGATLAHMGIATSCLKAIGAWDAEDFPADAILRMVDHLEYALTGLQGSGDE